jgi:hypothetical protein
MSWDPTTLRWACTSRSPLRYMLGCVVPGAPESGGFLLRAPVASVTRAADLELPPRPEGLTDIETAALGARQSGWAWIWEAETAAGELVRGPAMSLTEAMRTAEHATGAPSVPGFLRYNGHYRGGASK